MVKPETKSTTAQAAQSLHASLGKDAIFVVVSAVLLAAGMTFDAMDVSWFVGVVRIGWYAVAYLPVGAPVLYKAIKLAIRREVFTEFLLMSLATAGAFYLGEFPEGVAVMLFYSFGELLQSAAVNRAKRSIRALLDVRPETASVMREGSLVNVHPENVAIGETIQVRVGDRVPLDGTLESDATYFNTSALTGETKPINIERGGAVLAGMINDSAVARIKATRLFNESALSRILTMVQEAQGRKAKTELFIRRFARGYTPAVVGLAAALVLLPYFFVTDYQFDIWLYRALIFLVISCPCALVVAIPLGYFGGIGAGSRNGILFKGSSYLDRMTRVGTVVLDKTGTLTDGAFRVREVVSAGPPEEQWLSLAAIAASASQHPASRAIVDFVKPALHDVETEQAEEIKGYGIRARAQGREVVMGSARMLARHGIEPAVISHVDDTVVQVAIDKKLVGYFLIADALRVDALAAVKGFHAAGIHTVVLSGDRQESVDRVAAKLGIDQAFGDLLPEQKVEKLEAIQKQNPHAVAFVGDGINDAPALALSDVGIAMGGLGTAAAIESADVVIQTDQPSKILTAIRIGKATNAIVWQNIALAFGVKIVVMALGAGGLASMWEAVFADVGVALLAIVNALRIQRMRF